MNHPLVWAEVDLGAIAHNTAELRRATDPAARLMVAVKANGYGHGAVQVARKALESGAQTLGVARIDEGVELREAGLDAPILIFGYTPPELVDDLLAFGLTQTIYSLESADALSAAAAPSGKKLKVHFKVDTGMGRLGIVPDSRDASLPGIRATGNAVSEIRSAAQLSGLELEGVYTHFATADHADKTYAGEQYELFLGFLGELRKVGLEIPIRHAANSAAIIDMPETHLDMVRAGIALYGLYPSEQVKRGHVALKPAMAVKTEIVQLKEAPAGFKISYGSTHETNRPTTIATVPIGYADGLDRRLSSRGHMLVRGHRVPIVGRVCMDLTMLDVGEVPGVQLGDEAVVFGEQGSTSITVDEVASELGTINYEIVSRIAHRVPRVYIDS